MAERLAPGLALAAHPVPNTGSDTAGRARREAEKRIRAFFAESADVMADLPGIKDIVEYSRSIYAEMNTLLSAARNGISPRGATLYCTTYPCHNCARHLVTAGIECVYFIEPYVRNSCDNPHSDSISTVAEFPLAADGSQKPTHMVVVPFTGVGPRMYEDFFTKKTELKRVDGSFEAPNGSLPAYAVRLRELRAVEERAAALVPEIDNG